MGAEDDALYETGRHASGSHEIPCVSVQVEEPVHPCRFCITSGAKKAHCMLFFVISLLCNSYNHRKEMQSLRRAVAVRVKEEESSHISPSKVGLYPLPSNQF